MTRGGTLRQDKGVDKQRKNSRKPKVADVTAKKRGVFLRSLARHGNATKAASAALISRKTAYQWRNDCSEFAEEWDQIIEGLIDAAEAELYRRGVNGVLKPVFQGGEKVGQVREFDTTALIFFLKCNKDKYRPAQKLEHSGVLTLADAVKALSNDSET